VNRHPEILRAKQKGLGELDYFWPVWVLGGLDRVTDALFQLSPRRFLKLEERKLMLEVRPAGGRLPRLR
jgi:hypothetical protein